jgi:hypothetical protein
MVLPEMNVVLFCSRLMVKERLVGSLFAVWTRLEEQALGFLYQARQFDHMSGNLSFISTATTWWALKACLKAQGDSRENGFMDHAKLYM